jgi:hypothetical protein
MDQHREGTIRYALGFVDDFIEDNTEPLEGEGREEENEHRQQVLSMMKILREGVIQVCKENWSLRNKIALIKSAMNTPI